MATSHSHKFGQIIGDLLETAILPLLEKFVKQNKLFLDKKGERKARNGKKVSWIDNRGNKHDLDFVIERGGTEEIIGTPIAFIESAWRRYTKHSRNKAQEIQSAIIPLVEKYTNLSPFFGVVLAGEFTEGALNQLKSLGFVVLYFPYSTVVKAFLKYGIDASFDESTEEENFESKILQWQKLENKQAVAKELLKINKKQVDEFFGQLLQSVSRFIENIRIVPLHGKQQDIISISEAIDFLNEYSESKTNAPLMRYEITIKYNTGDKIEASFKTKTDALRFLKNYT
jgi:hypothetical protein